ncbi:hypothetical protein [Lysobacter antibioticus]|uniref:hypothetical protein n=1 Tax=Lysobacter antibioticus TaxID=84531 RepID=UPI00118756B4|nr:hypothetical protein [Lysobacter antibioticus]
MDPVAQVFDVIGRMPDAQLVFMAIFMLIPVVGAKFVFHLNNKRLGRNPVSRNPFFMMATFNAREWLVFGVVHLLTIASAAAAVRAG